MVFFVYGLLNIKVNSICYCSILSIDAFESFCAWAIYFENELFMSDKKKLQFEIFGIFCMPFVDATCTYFVLIQTSNMLYYFPAVNMISGMHAQVFWAKIASARRISILFIFLHQTT